MADKEVAFNRRSKCPKCGSQMIDQEASEDIGTVVWYHCAWCGCWYNDKGEIDMEDTVIEMTGNPIFFFG
jgi:DNA-directed RNA polymerase subunit M/transcription elongation factor TFIIS